MVDMLDNEWIVSILSGFVVSVILFIVGYLIGKAKEKKRKFLNQDKLNYEIKLGDRKFKCTTIPIFRKDYGLVGAICINIDVHYISEEVIKTRDNIEYFFKEYCRSEMELQENILSKYEFELAQKGKKHWNMRI